MIGPLVSVGELKSISETFVKSHVRAWKDQIRSVILIYVNVQCEWTCCHSIFFYVGDKV